MNSFTFDSAIKVVFGENAVDRLGGIAGELGGKRILVVTDKGIRAAGQTDRAIQSLRTAGLHAILFDSVEENPTTEHVERGLRVALEHQPIDLIVAIGGGSALDCAKGINFLFTNGGKMEDYWGSDKARLPMLPSIGIPTTAGTGSEAQSYALISQSDSHIKMACGDKKARFRAVILDPSLTTTMPRAVTAITGMDAITHSIESYVTLNRNPLSQMFSREAWRLLDANFQRVLEAPADLEARAGMLVGSHFAGTAIEYSMLGAAHACANPLTAHFNVTHGVAVSLMLPAVVRRNMRAVNALYGELIAGGGEALHERLLALRDLAALPARLRDCSVTRDAIPTLAKEAAQQWTAKHNPVSLQEHDFAELYEVTY